MSSDQSSNLKGIDGGLGWQGQKLDLIEGGRGHKIKSENLSILKRDQETVRKEALVVDLTYECLEEMDNLILQSSRGIHLLFEKQDILAALADGKQQKDEHDIEKLKLIQKILYRFISLKEIDEKKSYIKTLKSDHYSLLIRAYFKILENSMMNRSEVRH